MVSCTLRDVARAAGVSIATVSRVVNGVEHVSSATKSKVLVAISVLGYTPDIHALELSRRKHEGRRIDKVKKFSANGKRQEVNSVLPVQALNDWRKAARVHVLEEENVRLRRLITNLIMDVEMRKRLAK